MIKRVQPEVKRFGWCMDNHHENCVYSYLWESEKVFCECECHKIREQELIGV